MNRDMSYRLHTLQLITSTCIYVIKCIVMGYLFSSGVLFVHNKRFLFMQKCSFNRVCVCMSMWLCIYVRCVRVPLRCMCMSVCLLHNIGITKYPWGFQQNWHVSNCITRKPTWLLCWTLSQGHQVSMRVFQHF